MEGGALDRNVTIQVNQPTRDAAGGEVDNWITFGAADNIPAGKIDRRAREFFSADQVVGEAATVWRIRWRPDIRMKMRVVHGADIWNIESVEELRGRRTGLDLFCTRQGA